MISIHIQNVVLRERQKKIWWNPKQGMYLREGSRSWTATSSHLEIPLVLFSANIFDMTWQKMIICGTDFCCSILELRYHLVNHKINGEKKGGGSILTYLYTKLKMNALGIIKWNNSIRECHSNERPVDFQVNRNQQKTLFKQIHLIKKRKRNVAITTGFPNQQQTAASIYWPLTCPRS